MFIMYHFGFRGPSNCTRSNMSEFQPLTMTIQLLGGLALFLYDMGK